MESGSPKTAATEINYYREPRSRLPVYSIAFSAGAAVAACGAYADPWHSAHFLSIGLILALAASAILLVSRRRFTFISALLASLLLACYFVVATTLMVRGSRIAYASTNDVRCRYQLSKIARALSIYRSNHGGNFPPDLRELVGSVDVEAKDLFCPGTAIGQTNPPPGGDWAKLVAAGHTSYEYDSSTLKNNADPSTVVLYEKLSNHSGEGIHVVHADGRVEWLSEHAAKAFLDRLKTDRVQYKNDVSARPRPVQK